MSKEYTLREWFAVALRNYKVSYIQIIPVKRFGLLCLFTLLRLLFSLKYVCICMLFIYPSFASECRLYIKSIWIDLIIKWTSVEVRTYNGINDASCLEITCKSHPKHLKHEDSLWLARNRVSQPFKHLEMQWNDMKRDGASGSDVESRFILLGLETLFLHLFLAWKLWQIQFHFTTKYETRCSMFLSSIINHETRLKSGYPRRIASCTYMLFKMTSIWIIKQIINELIIIHLLLESYSIYN